MPRVRYLVTTARKAFGWLRLASAWPALSIAITETYVLYLWRSISTFVRIEIDSFPVRKILKYNLFMSLSRSSSEDQLPTSNPERSSRGDHGRNRASFDPSSIRSLCGRHRQQSFVIKFPCCNEYFHCIVCHDLSEPCSRKNLKQFDAQSLKCLDCKKCQRVCLNNFFTVLYSFLHEPAGAVVDLLL